MLYVAGTACILIVPIVVRVLEEDEGNRQLCYRNMSKIVVKCDYRR